MLSKFPFEVCKLLNRIETVLAILRKSILYWFWILKAVVYFAYELCFGCSLYFWKKGNTYFEAKMFVLLTTA